MVYSQVTCIPDVLEKLQLLEEEEVEGDISPPDVITVVVRVNQYYAVSIRRYLLCNITKK